MVIKTFQQFINEKWVLDVRSISNESTPVYENPTSSDLVAFAKIFKTRFRLIAIKKTRQLFIWDATAVLHLPMIQRLKAEKMIPSDVDYEAPKTVFCGECHNQSGTLVYRPDAAYDINFAPAFHYAKKGLEISKGVLPKGFNSPETFVQELEQMCKDYAFVDKYIESFTKNFPPSEILEYLLD